MKQTNYAQNSVPTANIAVNKSRLKVYKNVGNLPTYYLQKGQEFQIELANPTTDVVLAKVSINNKVISQGGLVLNPGQRVFLERYLDVAKKFLFDTYEVSGSNEMKEAIKNNGDIKIEFYRESQPKYNPILISNYPSQSYYNSNISTGTPMQFLRSGSTSGLGLSSGSITTTALTNASGTINCADGNGMTGAMSYTSGIKSFNSPSLDELSFDIKSSPKHDDVAKRSGVRSRLSKETIETGRVEKGSYSDQTFRTVNKDFEYYAFHTIEYKLLPISQKINTTEDINIKMYCTKCGSKLGKTDKFCAQCGTKK